MKLLVAISFWKIPVSSKTPSQGHRPAGVDLKGLSNFQKTGVFCQALNNMIYFNLVIYLQENILQMDSLFQEVVLSLASRHGNHGGSGYLLFLPDVLAGLNINKDAH